MYYTTLINTEQLSNYPNPCIFDCRFDLSNPEAGAVAYTNGHIPNAHYLHLDKDLCGIKTGKNGRHPLPNPSELLEKLRNCGVSKTSQIIAYDAQGGAFAARLWWLLRWLGHAHVAVLNGGFQAWQATHGELSQTVSQVTRGTITGCPSLQKTVDAFEVLKNISQPRFQLVDARAPDRFRGENETLDPVSGHIPGACNRFFKDNLQADGYFKDAAQLRQEWEMILSSFKHPSIHHCGSGVTACVNIFALEIAGISNAFLYPGSWSEWCTNPANPIIIENT